MSGYFLGQIGVFGFNFAPRGWATCSAQILSIAQNTALFSLLGTTYGGNGQTTFGLPDLRSRTPIGFSNTTSLGEMAGTENVTLTVNEMPTHTHPFTAASALADELQPLPNSIFGQSNTGPAPGTPANFYGPATPNITLNPSSVSLYGGSQPHNNLQPLLCINFCIAITGIYPSRN